jgi:acyl-CoA thioester hydrolase
MPAIHSAAVEQAVNDPPGFRWNVRVYFEDTDAAGIVYYANYLKYFERCRTEWLRSFGIDQRELAQREQRQFVVADLAVQFHRPARLDDALLIEATVAERARSYLVFAQRALRHGELLATARVKVACVDTARLAPSRLPQRLTGPLFAAATSPAA